jgi:hypothetical protein
MKTVILILALFFSGSQTFAQVETLVKGDWEHGWYCGPLLKVGQTHGDAGIYVGGQGGWIINHQIVIGGVWNGLANNVEVDGKENLKLDFDYGGAKLEYIFSPDRLLHISLESMFGIGGVRYEVMDFNKTHDEINYSRDQFFIMEPGINAVLNVSRHFRISLGATYRHIGNVKYDGLSSSDLSGLSGQVVLKFGSF